MNALNRGELTQLKESVQQLALQIARLSQAVEPLVRMQEEQGELRDRVAGLEGFKAAILWLLGLMGASAAARYLLMLWRGGA